MPPVWRAYSQLKSAGAHVADVQEAGRRGREPHANLGHRRDSTGRSRRTQGWTANSSQRCGTPFSWNSPRDSRARPEPADDVADRARHEDLARPGLRTDPSGDVHGEAGEIVTAPFALTRVDAGAHREPRGAGRLDDRDRGAHRAASGIERRDEAVAGRVDLPPAEAAELRAHDRIVRVQFATPGRVAEFGRVSGRVDDVGEEHRRQHPVRGPVPVPGQELLDLVEHRVGGRRPRHVVGTRHEHELRTLDARRDVAAEPAGHETILLRVQHQRAGADRGEPVTNVGADGQREVRTRVRGARGPSRRVLDPLAEPHVPSHARREEIEVVGAFEAPLGVRIGIVAEEALDEVGRNAFRVALGRGKPRVRIAEHQRVDPVSGARRELDRDRTRRAPGDDRGMLAPDRVEHRNRILRGGDERPGRVRFIRIGLPDATVIEVDHAAERREAAVVARNV